MLRPVKCRLMVGISMIAAVLCVGMTQQAFACKVLVVMSYEENFPWDVEVKEGVEQALAKECDVTYFYMDTKIKPDGGEQKAKEAYDLYLQLQPDGVIAADDNAQSMFVVPYLKDKVKTPVMFCGVNAELEKYGYPASNVSGILERINIKESLGFALQLVPTIKTFGYLAKDSETGQANLRQFQAQTGLPAQFIVSTLPKTFEEALAAVEALKQNCDALFLETFQGIPDKDGNALSDTEALPVLAQAFGKPTLSPFANNVNYGVLCAVVRTGQEQGSVGAEMLLKAIKGTPVSELAVTQNQYGRRIINIETMQALGIKPNPAALRGAEMVKTEKK